MSNELVKSVMGPVETSFALLKKFIEVCPENIWAEKTGGWPVWQQVYHVVGAVNFFILGVDEQPQGPAPLTSPEVGGLKEVAAEAVSKEKVAAALEAAQDQVAKFAASLSDADLIKKNEGIFARAKMDMTFAGTITLLAGHNFYHLGSCDAALRNHGLEGVF